MSDQLQNDLSGVCGCEPAQVEIRHEPGRLVARAIVIGAGASRPTTRFFVGETPSEVVGAARAYVARRTAMFPPGGGSVVVDMDAIDGGEDNPRPRTSGPSLIDRIEALEAALEARIPAGRG